MAISTAAQARTTAAPPFVGPDEYGAGLQRWNLQAWVDYLMVRAMMARIGPLIPRTYMPILRLVCEDVEKIDDAYDQLVARRERVRFSMSPRDKWRIIYGTYVRELEWVYGELRNYFPPAEYQELVQDIMARAIREAMGPFHEMLQRTPHRVGKINARPLDARTPRAEAQSGAKRPSLARTLLRPLRPVLAWVGGKLLANVNPAGFMVGPVEMTSKPGGRLEMYIPRCYMHTAPGDGRTQDQACVQGCKGACEKVFGPDMIAHMTFTPHLPDYSCTLDIHINRPA